MHRKIVTVAATSALALGLAVGFAQPAIAANGGGCPQGDGWTLAPTAVFIDELDNGNIADQNGDGLACFRANKGQTDKKGA